MKSQRTANSGLTGCLSLGVHRNHANPGFHRYDDIEVSNVEVRNILAAVPSDIKSKFFHDRYRVRIGGRT